MIRSLATSAIALIVGAAPVFADVTPAQAWENLSQYYQKYGYEVTTGNVEDAGNTLTVTDTVLSMAVEGGSTTITIPQMTFQETGDAKVRATIDGDVTFDSSFDAPVPAEAPAMDDTAAPDETTGTEAPQDETAAPEADPAAEPETVTLTASGTLTMPGNDMLISGTPEDMLYEFTYPTISFDMSIPVDPETGVTIPLTGNATNLTGTQRNIGADSIESTFDMAADTVTLASNADIPATADNGGGGKMAFDIALTALTTKGTATAPEQEFDLGTQLAQAIQAGLGFDGSLAYETLTGTFSFSGTDLETGTDKTAAGEFSTGASDLTFALDKSGLGYGGSSVDSKFDLTVSDLPFPISYAIAKTSADIQIPAAKSDSAQPFKLAYTLEGLTLADGIWNLFDPTSQLPRDPATLVIDLAGDALVTADLFDPATSAPQTDDAGMPVAPEVPFMPQNLTITRIALDAAGAKADLKGELDLSQNPQEPVGTIDGQFTGVNGLLDKVVAMGLVPEDQMMGMRMMLAMFAKPVEGQGDQMQTQIEFREGGSIFANGQQIK